MLKNRLTYALMRAWMQRGWFAYLTWPLAQLFGIVIRLRTFLYQRGWLAQYKLPVPVIVVGNIFVGGTGKTPFTLWLLQELKKLGYRPGVISRGYASQGSKDARVVSPDAQPAHAGDEPVLLAQQSACPVVVGPNRVEAGQFLLATFPEVNVIIADDGLQHLALARDVEVMLFDARGVGNGWLLPAGPLREPSARRRDITIANLNADQKIPVSLPTDTARMQLTTTRIWQLSDGRKIQVLSTLNPELKIVAAAGIGHPERFFAMLRQQGVRCTSLPLPDHFDYASNPFHHLSADLILITEKDAVKCRLSPEIAADPRIWVVAVTAQVDAGVLEKILNKINRTH
jgi:tetraacyldisaccharide 4'-kinase